MPLYLFLFVTINDKKLRITVFETVLLFKNKNKTYKLKKYTNNKIKGNLTMPMIGKQKQLYTNSVIFISQML